MRTRQCPHCNSYIDVREIVTRCTECGNNIYLPKTDKMKATLENFLVKWDGNNPLWNELIEWLNSKPNGQNYNGKTVSFYYGYVSEKTKCQEILTPYLKSLIITLKQWKQMLIRKKENMKNIFKKGDTVYHHEHGEGIFSQDPSTLEYHVAFLKAYCSEPALIGTGIYELLSFTPYKLEGFMQERPFEPVVGQMYYFWTPYTIRDRVVGYGEFRGMKGEKYMFGNTQADFCSEKNPLL